MTYFGSTSSAPAHFPPGAGKAVIVNATAAELVMVEDGRVVDTMRVVVGKPVHPTPMMAALIRFTSLNPYWNVPADLAAERIAPNVVKGGAPYLRAEGLSIAVGLGRRCDCGRSRDGRLVRRSLRARSMFACANCRDRKMPWAR